MIALVLAMIGARVRQAATLLVLSAFATAAAVAAPIFLDTVQRVVVDNEVRAAPPQERMLQVPAVGVPDPPDRRMVEEVVPKAITVPGFTRVFFAEVPVLGVEAGEEASRLVFRADACAPHPALDPIAPPEPFSWKSFFANRSRTSASPATS